MALASVTGRCWSGLARVIPGFRSVAEGIVTTIGVRDLDEESGALNASDVRRVEVDSLRADLPRLYRISVVTCQLCSLDLDVLDPVEGHERIRSA